MAQRRIHILLPAEVVDYIDKQTGGRDGKKRSGVARYMILNYLDANSLMEYDNQQDKWVEVKK